MRGETIKRIIAPALCLAVLLTGCRGAGASASGEGLSPAGSLPAQSVSAGEPEEPPYSGPLYAVSIEDIRDSLPDFRGFKIDTQNEITEEYKARYMLMGEMIDSLIELEETYSLRDYTREGERVRGASITNLFSEGRVPVVFAESTDTLFHIMGQNGETDFDSYSAECDVAGYLDKSGAFALKFSELPQFEDQIIVRASSFYGGTAIIVARPRERSSGVSVHRHDLYAGTYYEIDTEGNILRECTEDTWWEHGEKGNANGRSRSRNRIEHPEVIPADRLLLRDDLVLYKNQADQRYELLDATGAYKTLCLREVLQP